MGTKIEWTEETWNPVTGCTKISSGCKNCYAENMAKRWHAAGKPRYRNGFELTLQPDRIKEPFSWTRKPRKVFVNSMSDMFHEGISDDYIKEVFETMNNAPKHTFQVLTKRSERLRKLAPELNWTPNIWMGVTVEGDEVKHRIDDLLHTEAAIKFISFEPLISRVELESLAGIDWAIVGGESGRGWRPMEIEWVDDIHSICKEDDVAFFFKQWAGFSKKKSGRIYRGQEWNEYPA